MYSPHIKLKKTFDLNGIFLLDVSVEMSTIGENQGDSGDDITITLTQECMGFNVDVYSYERDKHTRHELPHEIKLHFKGEAEAALIPKVLHRIASIIELEMPKLQKEADFNRQ